MQYLAYQHISKENRHDNKEKIQINLDRSGNNISSSSSLTPDGSRRNIESYPTSPAVMVIVFIIDCGKLVNGER